jgi:hypothetical protein
MKKLIKIFKHLFIPHVHNDYKPHFFREASITSILIVVVFLLTLSIGSKLYILKTNMTAEVLPAVLVDLANQDRSSVGVPTLARSELLDTAARLKAEDMASSQYFAHTSPTGITPWHWFAKVGYYFTYAGENLAIDFTESLDVENAWLNSPKHKENIMSSNFTEIGIATVNGYYQGSPTTYVVQMFGKPAFAKAETKTTPIATSSPQVAIEKPAPANLQIAIAPVVKGESTIKEEELKTVIDTNNFISVKNTAVNEEVILETQTTEADNLKYSTWQERLMFLLPSYTNGLYKIFVWVVLIALSLMTIIEIRKKHPKNITYGVLLIVIIFCFPLLTGVP